MGSSAANPKKTIAMLCSYVEHARFKELAKEMRLSMSHLMKISLSLIQYVVNETLENPEWELAFVKKNSIQRVIIIPNLDRIKKQAEREEKQEPQEEEAPDFGDATDLDSPDPEELDQAPEPVPSAVESPVKYGN